MNRTETSINAIRVRPGNNAEIMSRSREDKNYVGSVLVQWVLLNCSPTVVRSSDGRVLSKKELLQCTRGSILGPGVELSGYPIQWTDWSLDDSGTESYNANIAPEESVWWTQSDVELIMRGLRIYSLGDSALPGPRYRMIV